MNNVSKIIRQAYYDALQGVISVEVFKESAPTDYNEHHVVIRVESETDSSHRKGFVTNPIVITEVVGVFMDSIDPDVVDDIEDEIKGAIKPDTNTRPFNTPGYQILNVKAESSTSFPEDDGTKRYYRKITRWTQRISHT